MRDFLLIKTVKIGDLVTVSGVAVGTYLYFE